MNYFLSIIENKLTSLQSLKAKLLTGVEHIRQLQQETPEDSSEPLNLVDNLINEARGA